MHLCMYGMYFCEINEIEYQPIYTMCFTMHHFVTEMCTQVHISVTKWCVVGMGLVHYGIFAAGLLI